MRVPSKRVITEHKRGTGQNHHESDESEWLQKRGSLKPDKKSDESAASGREQAANGALLGIVTQGSQLGGEIERGTENGKSEQPQADVSVLRGFKMQIDDDAAIEGERADQRVLHLKVLRFESASKSCDDDHDGGEGERGPVARKKGPGSGCGGESAKIGMDSQQRAIRRAGK